MIDLTCISRLKGKEKIGQRKTENGKRKKEKEKRKEVENVWFKRNDVAGEKVSGEPDK